MRFHPPSRLPSKKRLPRPAQLQLSGDHGAANALAALAATRAYGAPIDAARRGLEAFAGVPNRMEEVATVDGVLFVNDTAASAPVAAIAGLRVLSERANRVHLIAGGADKKTDLTPFADEIARLQPRVLLLDGTATPRLRELLEERGIAYEGPFTSMAAAVRTASEGTTAGDVVTLTPACASFGMFRNEFVRGEQFRAAVRALHITV